MVTDRVLFAVPSNCIFCIPDCLCPIGKMPGMDDGSGKTFKRSRDWINRFSYYVDEFGYVRISKNTYALVLPIDNSTSDISSSPVNREFLRSID